RTARGLSLPGHARSGPYFGWPDQAANGNGTGRECPLPPGKAGLPAPANSSCDEENFPPESWRGDYRGTAAAQKARIGEACLYLALELVSGVGVEQAFMPAFQP